MNFPIPQNKALVAAILGLVAVAAALILVAASTEADSTEGASEAVAGEYAVLSSSNVEAAPSNVASALSLVEQMSGAPADSFGVADLASGDTALVAATGQFLCVAEIDGQASCGDADQAKSGDVFGATPAGCDAYRVVGLVPDGVDELVVSGQDASIPVTDNVYSATLAAVDTALASQDGSVSVDLPLGWYAKDNSGCN